MKIIKILHVCVFFSANRCQRLVDQIGTAQDSHNLTSQIQDYQHNSNELAKTTNTLLRNLTESLRNAPPNVKVRRDVKSTAVLWLSL